MGLYDNYRPENSQLTQQYAGSTVPALMQVGRELQTRFDTAKETYDLVGTAIDSSIVSEVDRPAYEQNMQAHRAKLKAAADAGDYENMEFEARKAGRSFATDYAPFADNYKRIQAYTAEVDDALEKGRLLDPETARKKKLAASMGYKGLTKDEKTGKWTNQFAGPGIAKELNLTEWTDGALKNFAAQTLGSEFRTIQQGPDGEYYSQQGSKTVKLTGKQIATVLEAAKKIDPEYSAYMNQKLELDTLGLENMKADMMPEGAMKTAIQAEADRLGVTFGEAAKSVQKRAIEQNTNNNVNIYSGKYIRDDREVSSKNMGLTEGATKALNDKDSNLGMEIAISTNSYEHLGNPADLSSGIDDANKQVQIIGEKYNVWAKNPANPIRKVGERYMNAKGEDVTSTAFVYRAQMDQAKAYRDNVVGLKNRAKEAAGFKVAGALETEALAAKNLALSRPRFTSDDRNLPQNAKNAIRLAQGEEAYENVIRDSPGYKRYAEKLKEFTKAGSITTVAKRFSSKLDNDRTEALVNGMSSSDIENGLVGFKMVGTQYGGRQMSADEYEKVAGSIKFAGNFVNAQGQFEQIYSAKDKAGNNFVFSGTNLKASGGDAEIAQGMGMDAKQVQLQQFVRQVTDNPSSSKTMQIPGGSIKVSRHSLEESKQIGKANYGSGSYTPTGGVPQILQFADEAQLLTVLQKALQQ